MSLKRDATPLRHAPATARNREPILEVLARTLPHRGLLLELASGTGEHGAFMADRLPGSLIWQPSDIDPDALPEIDAHSQASGSTRIRPALLVDACAPDWPVASADAILCCNMIHIAPWAAAEGLFAGAARVLSAAAPLILYGPFKRHGEHISASNERFDAGLRERHPDWGVRCLDSELIPLATAHGFALAEIVAMPANNLTLVWRSAAGNIPIL